ncbi:hypothetical protein LZ30DRAFT_704127 [Colletotrichum cereale]|nr:hypothetical protein LZ30DRAFT_704127 [Colletotrichum cereale]
MASLSVLLALVWTGCFLRADKSGVHCLIIDDPLDPSICSPPSVNRGVPNPSSPLSLADWQVTRAQRVPHIGTNACTVMELALTDGAGEDARISPLWAG